MGKHDMPSLQFKVDGGRLVPAGPYEQEVIDTYQRGAEITVTLHQKRTLPLLKKYWAVLRDVVSNCKTPWNSTEEASDALKLALGVTDIGKTVSGQWFIRAGSISFNSMDQAAFKDFFDKAMAVLAGVTGIDPETLSQRYRHLAEHEPAGVSSVSGQGSSLASPSGEAAADQSEPASAAEEAGEPEVREEPSTAPASVLSSTDREFLVRVFKTMKAAVGPEANVFKRQALVFSDEIGGKSELVMAKAKTIRERLQECCGDAPTKGTVEVGRYLAGVIGVDEKELVN